MDVKVNEIQSRLAESYRVVDRKEQENVRLTEENRTLTKLLEVPHLENEEVEAGIEKEEADYENELPADIIFIDNGDDPNDDKVIDAYLSQFSCEGEKNDVGTEEEEEEEIAEILDLGDYEDPDDDDIIEFYLQQNINRAKRTSPMTEASKNQNFACKMCQFKAKTKVSLTEHEKSKHKVKCTKCSFTTETTLQLNWHKEAQHKDDENQPSGRSEETIFRCDKCDFVAKSTVQLEKHTKVTHSKLSGTCWNNGFCERNNCRHEHPRVEGRPPIPCRYQPFCKRTECPFFHHEVQRNMITQCRFGSFCENNACRLEL